MAVPPAISKYGYEIQLTINHLAHALLMKLCLSALQNAADEKGGARIVRLTPLEFQSEPKAGIVFKDLKSSQENLGRSSAQVARTDPIKNSSLRTLQLTTPTKQYGKVVLVRTE